MMKMQVKEINTKLILILDFWGVVGLGHENWLDVPFPALHYRKNQWYFINTLEYWNKILIRVV